MLYDCEETHQDFHNVFYADQITEIVTRILHLYCIREAKMIIDKKYTVTLFQDSKWN